MDSRAVEQTLLPGRSLGQALLARSHHSATLAGPGVLRAVIGSARYITLCGLFAFAAAAIIKNTAGTITAMIGLLFVIPALVNVLPHGWQNDLVRWLPSSAARTIPDDNALQLGYAWARWVCRRNLTTDGTTIDAGRVEAALTKARQALARHQSARSCFTAATKKIDEGAGHVTTLVEEVRAALAELSEELNGS